MNGIALSGGTMARLGIGFLTWLVAARLYSSFQVGMAAAAVSAMLLCVQLGTLGVDLALIALYPRHRESPGRLLDTGITLGTAMALIPGLLCVGLSLAGFRSLHVIATSPLHALLFLLLTVLQASWWIIDQTSVALRRSDQVLHRATVAAALTLIGVVGFGIVGWDDATAILASWVGASIVACAMAFRQVARAARPYRFRPRLARQLTRSLVVVGLSNFAISAADITPGLVLPIVVAEVLSPRATAYWYVVWMMSRAAYTIPTAFGLNLFAAAADTPARLAAHVRDGFRGARPLAAAATVALAALGPFVLPLLGAQYAAHGSTPVRLMALATVPMVVIKVYLAACRATGRMLEGTVVAAGAGIAALTLGALAARSFGLSGVAVAWLSVQVIAAVGTGARLRQLLASA